MVTTTGVVSLITFLLSLAPKEILSLNYEIINNEPVTIVEQMYKKENKQIEKNIEEELSIVTDTYAESINQNLGFKDLTVHITYYTNIDDLLQGGQNDRIGVPLKAHGEPVIAMPADVPYGSYIDIDGMGSFKVVDTGGAIVWLDDNTCKVDVFIPDVSYEWIIDNTQNTVKTAKLYIED